MKTIYAALDGTQFDNKQECMAYEEKLKKANKTLKIISDMDSNGWGEKVEIKIDSRYRVMVTMHESYPHEGGVLFDGTMEEFINSYYGRISSIKTHYSERVLTEMNMYMSGHPEFTKEN